VNRLPQKQEFYSTSKVSFEYIFILYKEKQIKKPTNKLTKKHKSKLTNQKISKKQNTKETHKESNIRKSLRD